MPEIVEFDLSFLYDPLKSGISLPIVLSNGEHSVELHSKLDTGASYCIFERKYGELLGIEIEAGERVSIGTATGTLPAFAHDVDLWTFDFEWRATVLFLDDDGVSRNIVGRSGWLDRVKLGLIDYEGKLLVGRLS